MLSVIKLCTLAFSLDAFHRLKWKIIGFRKNFARKTKARAEFVFEVFEKREKIRLNQVVPWKLITWEKNKQSNTTENGNHTTLSITGKVLSNTCIIYDVY